MKILIDEVQDIDEKGITILSKLIMMGKTNVILTGDLHQAIHRGNFIEVQKLFEKLSDKLYS